MSENGHIFRLDFASSAWRHLGTLQRSDYQRVVNTLCSMAERAPRPARSGLLDAPVASTVEIGDLKVAYAIDHVANTVLVLDVQTRGPSPSA